jgi:hypothetical protein
MVGADLQMHHHLVLSQRFPVFRHIYILPMMQASRDHKTILQTDCQYDPIRSLLEYNEIALVQVTHIHLLTIGLIQHKYPWPVPIVETFLHQ